LSDGFKQVDGIPTPAQAGARNEIRGFAEDVDIQNQAAKARLGFLI